MDSNVFGTPLPFLAQRLTKIALVHVYIRLKIVFGAPPCFLTDNWDDPPPEKKTKNNLSQLLNFNQMEVLNGLKQWTNMVCLAVVAKGICLLQWEPTEKLSVSSFYTAKYLL